MTLDKLTPGEPMEPWENRLIHAVEAGYYTRDVQARAPLTTEDHAALIRCLAVGRAAMAIERHRTALVAATVPVTYSHGRDS